MFSLESPHTVFNIKQKIILNYPKSATIMDFFQGTQERVRNSRGEGAISVRAIEVLLNVYKKFRLQQALLKKYFSMNNISFGILYIYMHI